MDSEWQPDGIRMEPQETWRLFAIPDSYAFVRHLDMLFPEDCVLYLEGNSIADDIQAYTNERRPGKTTKIARGTICAISFFPVIRRLRPLFLHLPLTYENLEGLYDLMQHHAEPEIADHIHVYRDDTVLLEGHDWYDGVFYVTGEISEEKIRAFCDKVICRYERSFDYGPIQE